MVRKWSSIAKLCGRNFSSSAPIAQKKPTEKSMGLAWRSLGLAGGYGIATVTYCSKSQLVLEEEQRVVADTESLKALLREYYGL